MRIPFLDLRSEYEALREEILAALDRTGRSAAFVLGEEVEAFEREFASMIGVAHVVAVNSGTSALHLAVLAAGVEAGDEVITTPNSFIAPVEVIYYAGAKPVLADVDSATGNLDAKRVERAVTPRTRAMIPVHLYGRPADLDALGAIAGSRNIAIIEDACQAHGARWRGRHVGTIGAIGTFSFYPTKNLATYGEGGALVTNDERIAGFARAARNHGQSGRYTHKFIGFNYRMQGYQAAVLRVKMKRLAEWTERRKQIAKRYRERLAEARLEIPPDDPRGETSYHQFAVFLERRDAVQKELDARGIETSVHYPRPLHLQPACAALGYEAGKFPNAERACERVLCLPIYPALSDERVDTVAENLLKIAGRA